VTTLKNDRPAVIIPGFYHPWNKYTNTRSSTAEMKNNTETHDYILRANQSRSQAPRAISGGIPEHPVSSLKHFS